MFRQPEITRVKKTHENKQITNQLQEKQLFAIKIDFDFSCNSKVGVSDAKVVYYIGLFLRN